MFCSGCGRALEQGQVVCPQCNRPVAPPVPPVPGFEYILAAYAGKIRVLGILWLVYAGVSLVGGFVGLAFAHTFIVHGFGPWMNGNGPQMWFVPTLLRFAWIFLAGRSILAAVAGWGLLERTEWGRIVAIVAAILNLFHFFPLGLALGIATLILLIGQRNWALYEDL
ncbi:MAG TPA: hypothetical protein VMT38_02555 [Terracidiphilus sp.]|nr:hypothetical protein [Terracidiphilus sp.]